MSVRTLHTASDIVRDARFSICAALVTGGPESALAAVAASSIRLARWAAAGELIWLQAVKMLAEVSGNLQLVKHFGNGAVDVAIHAGAAFYSDISAEIDNEKQEAA